MRAPRPSIEPAAKKTFRSNGIGGLQAEHAAVGRIPRIVHALVASMCLAACGLSFDVPVGDTSTDLNSRSAQSDAAGSVVARVDAIDAAPTVAERDGAIPPTCSDNVRNGSETDVDCGGECGARCALGATCIVADDCTADSVCHSSVCAAAESCKSLHEARPGLTSGIYRVGQARDGGDNRNSCEMAFQGGGWTLVLKADGTKETFAYDAALWTNGSLLNPTKLDPYDKTEAKLAAYRDVPFTEMALMFEAGMEKKAIVLPLSSQSVAALIAAGATSNRGRSDWLAAMSGSALQNNCNAEGVSVIRGGVKVRIGIIGNNEPNCDNPDSFIGIGGNPLCRGSTSSGNVACYNNGPSGDRDLPAFARIFVR